MGEHLIRIGARATLVACLTLSTAQLGLRGVRASDNPDPDCQQEVVGVLQGIRRAKRIPAEGFSRVIDRYGSLFCGIQGSIDAPEGSLWVDSFIDPTDPKKLMVDWISERRLVTSSEDQYIGVVAGQARFTSSGIDAWEYDPGRYELLSGLRQDTLSSMVVGIGFSENYTRGRVPDYLVRIRVGSRREDQSTINQGGEFNVPTAGEEELAGRLRMVVNTTNVLIQLGSSGNWESSFLRDRSVRGIRKYNLDLGEIYFPLQEMRYYHQLIDGQSGVLGYSVSDLLSCPPPDGCLP